MPFSVAICTQLSKRVGGCCSRCRARTSGPHTDSDRSVSVGEGAHICGEKEDSARFDPNLSPDEVGRADNGIWLCATCHKTVDSDEEKYPADQLRVLKAEAEHEAGLVLGASPPGRRLSARSATSYRA